MKKIIAVLISTLFLALPLTQASAQGFTVKAHNVAIAGTSSLHDWLSAVENLECNGSVAVANHSITDIKDLVVKIPVTAIKSTKGKLMDTKTWEAFDHKKNPFITFVLTDKKIHASQTTADVWGNLTMAGFTRPVQLAIAIKALPGGVFEITGTKKLHMSDFKMEPPTAMMGTIKVGPEVTVTFEVVIKPTNTL